jgi:PmbA protein
VTPRPRPATPASPSEALAETLAALAAAGFDEVEVYAKRGRSRRLAHGPGGQAASFHHERGWAVRAGGRRGSFFAAGTGDPPPDGPWPEAAGPPLALPDPEPAPPWTEPADFAAPLIGEGEGLRLFESVERALGAELPGARLAAAVLEDGSAEQALASRRGVAVRFRNRLAVLRLEAVARLGGRTVAATIEAAAREARGLDVPALARRLADRLAAAAGEPPPERERIAVLAAPAVGARLLEGLLPLLVGPAAPARAAGLSGEGGRFAAPALTVVDDGRLPGGVLEAPADGEGVPTREAVLVAEGEYRGPLLAWHEARGDRDRAAGCSRRASWRDLPRPGPTHLYIRPRPGVGVGDLLAGVDRGAYLLDTTGAGAFDLAGDRFALPVCGFAVTAGRAVAPIGGAVLAGGVRALLAGVAAAARDLTFFPNDGLLGAPSLLLAGLELRKG